MKSIMLKAARAAGKIILKHYGKAGKLKFKSPRSIVTKADTLSEKIIIKTIRRKYPKHSFLSEESGYIEKNPEYTWIIDPIDGTTNFVSKVPYFAVSIGLARNNEILMGAVYNPCTNEMFFAEKGKGSYLNKKKISVTSKNKLEDSMLTFSLPNRISLSRKTLRLIARNFGIFRGIRNIGSASLNMCYLAAGKFDLYFSLSLSPWDAAAAKLIVEEAGGKVTNLKNRRWTIKDRACIATNKKLHKKFIKLLR